MTIYLTPPHQDRESLADSVVRAGWWLGHASQSGTAAVVLGRTVPDLSIAAVEPPANVDERISLRLIRADFELTSVRSAADYQQMLMERALQGDTVLCTNQSALKALQGDSAALSSAVLNGDEATNPEAPLAWAMAGAVAGGGEQEPGEQARAVLQRIMRDRDRMVVVGRGVNAADSDHLSREAVACDPLLVARNLIRGRTILTALDDPVRHLGPSRSAATLRDGLLSSLSERSNLFIAVPRGALGLIQSRLSSHLWSRLVPVDVPLMLVPGPATLIAAAGSLVDTVDVLWPTAEAEPLSADQIALHGAYARAIHPPTDLLPAISAAELAGAQVRALSRSPFAALAQRDRGRAPTRVFIAESTRHWTPPEQRFVTTGAVRNAHLVMREGPNGVVADVYKALADGQPTGESIGEVAFTGESSTAIADQLLTVVDEGMPDLVLSDPTVIGKVQPQASEGSIRSLEARLQGSGHQAPDGPFASPEDELQALLLQRRLLDRDLTRIHEPRLHALSEHISSGAFVVAADFDWRQINARRMRGRAIVAVGASSPPRYLQAFAKPLIRLFTRAQNRAQAEVNGNETIIVTLNAAHAAAPTDIIVDPKTLLLPQGTDPIGVATAAVKALGAREVYVLSPEPEAAVVGIPASVGGVQVLGEGKGRSVVADFHATFRARDWDDAPRLLLVAPIYADLPKLDELVSGLEDDLISHVSIEDDVRLVFGERITAGARVALPRFAPGSQVLLEYIREFAPEAAIILSGADRQIMPEIPSIAIRPNTEAVDLKAEAVLTTNIPLVDGWDVEIDPATIDAELDRLRVMLAAQVRQVRAAHVPKSRTSVIAPPAQSAARWLDAMRYKATDASNTMETSDQRDRDRPALGEVPEHHEPQWAGDVDAVDEPGFHGADDARMQHEPVQQWNRTMTARNQFAKLWPWPGTILLVLVSAWLFYMGSIADLGDVRTAFNGLGILAAIGALFGIRYGLFSGRRVVPAAQSVPRRDPMSVRPQKRVLNPEQDRRDPRGSRFGVPRRSMTDDSAGEMTEGGMPPERASVAEPASDGMPRNARMRARDVQHVQQDYHEDDPYRSAEPQRVGHAAEREVAHVDAPPAASPPPQSQAAPPPRPPVVNDVVGESHQELVAALRNAEAAINREKAERGAALVKLAEAVDGKLKGLQAAVSKIPSGAAPAASAPDPALLERLTALEEKIAALSAGDTSDMPGGTEGLVTKAALEQELEGYMSVKMLNQAVNTQLIPLLDKRTSERIDAAFTAESLREKLGDTQAALGDAGAAAGEEIAALKNDLKTARETAEKALKSASAASAVSAAGGIPEAVKSQLAQFQEFRNASASDLADLKTKISQLIEAGGNQAVAGDFSATKEKVVQLQERVQAMAGETNRTLSELKQSVRAMGQSVDQIVKGYSDVLSRVDNLDTAPDNGTGRTETSVEDEVQALRDALSTVIEQTKEIRAQQEVISAKFDAPTKIDLDTSR